MFLSLKNYLKRYDKKYSDYVKQADTKGLMYILLYYKLDSLEKNKFVLYVRNINELEKQLQECEKIANNHFSKGNNSFFKYSPLSQDYMLVDKTTVKNIHTGEELPLHKSIYTA